MKNYRITSWWFRWDDFNWPDKGIEDKLRRRAADFSAAGVDLAFVFGLHCRWDYVYCFDRIHELIRASCEACHEHGIRLFDHFSATCVHRPRSTDGEWKLYHEGRNRMTFHPSAEMAKSLAWRGSRLNDWRMLRVQDGSAAFIEGYQAEIFCMNNPDFRKASADYLVKLRAETGIDGLLFDDGVYYPGWDSCGCSHCRALFKKRSGQDLPEWRDTSFWGNYANPHFREWVRFRYDSAADFLKIPKDALGADFPLSACMGNTVRKSADTSGGDAFYFSRYVDYVQLEMCGEVSSSGLISRIPALLTQRAVAARKELVCYAIGFAFYPDSAFLIWALNKLFGLSAWISAGKGRVNVTNAEMSNLPNEEDIVSEGYNYEKNHPELFQGKPDCSCAVFYSVGTKINHGDCSADYENAFVNLTQSCFEANLPTDVIVTLDEAKHYPVLALADIACLSALERKILREFLEQGGIIVASGPLGTFDENGSPVENDFLQKFGLTCRLREPDRPIDAEMIFKRWEWLNQPREIPDTVEVVTDIEKDEEFYNFQVGKGQLYWSPRRLNNQDAVPGFLEQLHQSLPPSYRIETPDGLQWQAYRDGDSVIIHFLNTNFTQAPHPKYCYLNKPIGESLNYTPPEGELVIHGDFTHAELFSPDLDTVRQAETSDGMIRFKLDGVRRFCSARLK